MVVETNLATTGLWLNSMIRNLLQLGESPLDSLCMEKASRRREG